MCGVVVIELLEMLCRTVFSSSIALVASWIFFRKFYVDILAGRIQVRNVGYVQTRICIRCVMYDVKVPRDGWYISSYLWKRC